jgi:hypothetical protein
MPYKTEKLKLGNEFLDRRTKLLPCQKERVKHLYHEGVSITAIGKIMNVNKRSIQFILFPERLAKNISDRHDRGGWEQYYDKGYNNAAQRTHRRYKYNTLKDIPPTLLKNG